MTEFPPLAHVALTVRDLAVSVPWYEELFDADPVIDNGQVFAIGAGGRMVGLDLVSGQRLWELNLAGIATPWVAGDWIFVVTSDDKLMCIYRQNGRVRWISQLPQYAKPKSKKGDVGYSGPVLAGNHLVVTASNGQVVEVDPATGRQAARLSLMQGPHELRSQRGP